MAYIAVEIRFCVCVCAKWLFVQVSRGLFSHRSASSTYAMCAYGVFLTLSRLCYGFNIFFSKCHCSLARNGAYLPFWHSNHMLDADIDNSCVISSFSHLLWLCFVPFTLYIVCPHLFDQTQALFHTQSRTCEHWTWYGSILLYHKLYTFQNVDKFSLQNQCELWIVGNDIVRVLQLAYCLVLWAMRTIFTFERNQIRQFTFY